jgi:hypothetical protein
MKQWMKLAVTMLVVAGFAGLAFADMAAMNGEVTKYDAGKSISIKDDKGTEYTLEITKDTKTEGEVKAGSKVSVEAEGTKAHSIKAAMTAK